MINIDYNEKSIKTLEPIEHIRKHTGMYLGGKDAAALLQCVKEILSNSIDEYLNGSGSEVRVTFLPNNGISVVDNGRGIPHGTHQSGCSNLQACFGIINTGAKFDNENGAGYNSSGGQHGVGSTAVNAVSKKFIAKTRREGIEETVEFARGKFVSYSTKEIDKNVTGTSVEFYPDEEVLEVTTFDIEAIKTMIQEFSFLCKGLRFIVKEPDKETEYYSTKGLIDYINHFNKDNGLFKEPLYINAAENKFQLEVALSYNTSYSSVVKLYTNNIPQEKGTHLTGFKTAWTLAINNYAKEKKWLKDEEKLSGADLEEGMVLILNFKMIDPVFKGQNKEELSSSEGRTYTQKLATEVFKELLPRHEKDIHAIVEKAIGAKRAREAARKAREAARTIDKKKKEKVLKFDSKLADCHSKDRTKCEIYVVEGDSAAGNLKLARNNEFQAVLPVRGRLRT